VQLLLLSLAVVVAEVVVEEMAAVNAERMVTSPGIVLVEEGVEVEMGSVSTVVKKVTARVTVQNLRSVGGAARRGTSRMTAQSPRSATTVAKKATAQVTVQSQRSAGDAARRGMSRMTAQSPRSVSTVARRATTPTTALNLRSVEGVRRRGTR